MIKLDKPDVAIDTQGNSGFWTRIYDEGVEVVLNNVKYFAFSKYIESYTTGIISKESTIRIRLAGDVQISHEQNEALGDNIFDFSPSIKGKAYWVDARTIEFRPAGKLDPNKNYNADFKLGSIIKVPGHFEHFKFGFQTIKPDFTVTFTGLQTATNTSIDKMYQILLQSYYQLALQDILKRRSADISQSVI